MNQTPAPLHHCQSAGLFCALNPFQTNSALMDKRHKPAFHVHHHRHVVQAGYGGTALFPMTSILQMAPTNLHGPDNTLANQFFNRRPSINPNVLYPMCYNRVAGADLGLQQKDSHSIGTRTSILIPQVAWREQGSLPEHRSTNILGSHAIVETPIQDGYFPRARASIPVEVKRAYILWRAQRESQPAPLKIQEESAQWMLANHPDIGLSPSYYQNMIKWWAAKSTLVSQRILDQFPASPNHLRHSKKKLITSDAQSLRSFDSTPEPASVLSSQEPRLVRISGTFPDSFHWFIGEKAGRSLLTVQLRNATTRQLWNVAVASKSLSIAFQEHPLQQLIYNAVAAPCSMQIEQRQATEPPLVMLPEAHSNAQPDLEFRVEELSRTIKTLSDGTSACVEGVHGSLRPTSLIEVLSAGCGVANKNFVDFGSGDGYAVFASVLMGASRAIGIELPANEGLHNICNSVGERLVADGLMKPNLVRFFLNDIETLRRLEGAPHFVFAFWNGMSAQTRTAIISLVRGCPTCETLAVTNAKDETVDRLLVELNHKVSKACRLWSLSNSFHVSMTESGEEKTAWIFIRAPSKGNIDSPGFSHDFVAEVKQGRVDAGLDGPQVPAKGLKRSAKRVKDMADGDILSIGSACCELGMSEFKLLGAGGFGCVVSANWKGSRVAVKINNLATYSPPLDPLIREASAYDLMSRRGVQIAPETKRFHGLFTVELEGGRSASMFIMQGLDSDASALLRTWKEGLGSMGGAGKRPIESVRLFIQGALILIDRAHKLGLVHADLKPSNFLLKMPAKDEARVGPGIVGSDGTYYELRLGDWGASRQGSKTYGDEAISPVKTRGALALQRIPGPLQEWTAGKRRGVPASAGAAEGKPYPSAGFAKPISKERINDALERMLPVLSNGTPGFRDRDTLSKTNVSDAHLGARASDVFSIGCMLKDILNRHSRSGLHDARSIMEREPEELYGSLVGDAHAIAKEELDSLKVDSVWIRTLEFLKAVLNPNWKLRPTAAQLLRSAFVLEPIHSPAMEEELRKGIVLPEGWVTTGPLGHRYFPPESEFELRPGDKKSWRPECVLFLGPRGLGVRAGKNGFKKGDLLGVYGGPLSFDPDRISLHGLPIEHKTSCIDSSITAEWPLPRYLEIGHLAGFFNSSRDDPDVSNRGCNGTLARAHFVFDNRIAPSWGFALIFAKCDGNPGDEYLWDYRWYVCRNAETRESVSVTKHGY
jgi:serine/threonine protein kinase